MPISSPNTETKNAGQSVLRVDAHLHLWRYTPAEYAWIDDSMATLQRDFSPEDLIEPMQAAGVQYGIAVQARQDLAETRDLLLIASRSPGIAGVVGWLPVADHAGLSATLEEFSRDEHLVGVRHIVQNEPSGFLDAAAFNVGIEQLKQHDLVYDLLIHSGQLEEAVRLVDRHPYQSFVLDHLAKPRIEELMLQPWNRDIRELAKRPNVACKISGIVTEASWQNWSEDQLRPYLDVAPKPSVPGDCSPDQIGLCACSPPPMLIGGRSWSATLPRTLPQSRPSSLVRMQHGFIISPCQSSLRRAPGHVDHHTRPLTVLRIAPPAGVFFPGRAVLPSLC